MSAAEGARALAAQTVADRSTEAAHGTESSQCVVRSQGEHKPDRTLWYVLELFDRQLRLRANPGRLCA